MHRALILYHSTGSGKTLTAIFAMDQFPADIIIIGPKSSKKTFVDNIQKAQLEPSKFTFYTYAKIKRLLGDDLAIFKDKSVIVDEAHALRSENMNNLYIASALQLASRVLLLTATPIVNYMNDLSVLVNIVRSDAVLPTDRELFDQMFYDEAERKLINVRILFDKLLNTISYYQQKDDANYPKTNVFYKKVPMDHAQVDEYVYYIRKIIYAGVEFGTSGTFVSDVDILNIDYGLLPSKKRNIFLNVTRQLSNTADKSDSSPKIDAIFAHVASGPYPIIVYSNFLKNGIYPVAVRLEKGKISFRTITGHTSSDKLTSIVNSYNSGEFKVLLLSSAGSESLDLFNTRQIHIMEPHWNEARIDQVIGRAIRYKSHVDLPAKERRVDIYRWISVFPKPIINDSADQHLMALSQHKLELIDTYKSVIIRASIENNWGKNLNL